MKCWIDQEGMCTCRGLLNVESMEGSLKERCKELEIMKVCAGLK